MKWRISTVTGTCICIFFIIILSMPEAISEDDYDYSGFHLPDEKWEQSNDLLHDLESRANPDKKVVKPKTKTKASNRASADSFRDTKEWFKYRVVNWCVNGDDEDEFYSWPLVQFRPYFKKTRRYKKYDLEESKNNFNADPNPFPKDSKESETYAEKLKEAFTSTSKEPPEITLDFNAIQCDPRQMELWEWAEQTDPNPGPPPPAGEARPWINPLDGSVVEYKKDAKLNTVKYGTTNDWHVIPIGQNPNDLKWVDTFALNKAGIEEQWKKFNKFVMHQRVHIKLNIVYEPGVEGVVIQGNHAPFGLGFPYGQFYDKEESEDLQSCNDCNQTTFTVVPCLSRPDFQTLHPTLGVFHHQMSFLKNVSDTPFPKGYLEAGKRKEIHFNYKWNSHPCTSGSLVEFFVLVVYDFQRKKYEVRRFGPYDFSPWEKLKDAGFDYTKNTASSSKTILTDPPAAEADCFDPLDPNNNWGSKHPILNSYRIISHTNTTEVCPVVENVPSPSDLGVYILQPFLLASPLFLQCRRPKVHPSPSYCNVDEYGECNDGPYPMICHLKPAVNNPNPKPDPPIPTCTDKNPQCGQEDLPYDKINLGDTVPRIRINGLYDTQCIGNYSEKIPHKQCSQWSSIFKCAKKDEDMFALAQANYKSQYKTGRRLEAPLDPFFEETLCLPCDYPATTSVYVPPDESLPFFKRKVHSTLMILCFHFFLPISILIARHYKETFHICESKGWRLWLWLHFGLCVFGILLCYAGYSIPTYWEMDTHMIVGYTGVSLCGLGLLTGWLRHRKPKVNIVLQYLHSIPSYTGMFCGCLGLHFVEDISLELHMLSVIPPSTLILLIFFLQVPICLSDRKIGMHPKRKILPIQQIRFESQITPHHRGRLIIFIIYVLYSVFFAFSLMVV